MSEEVGSAHISVSADTTQFKADLVALKVQARKLGEAVGDSFMGGFLKKVRNGLRELAQSFAAQMAFIVAIVDKAGKKIQRVMAKVVAAFGTFRAAAKKAWSAIGRNVREALDSIDHFVKQTKADLTVLIVDALIPTALAFQAFKARVTKIVSGLTAGVSRHFRELRTDTLLIMEHLRFKLGVTVFKIQETIKGILDRAGITRVLTEARKFGAALGKAIGSGFTVGVDFAKSVVKRGVSEIKDHLITPLRTLSAEVKLKAKEISSKLGDAVSNSVIGKVGNKARELSNKISNSLPVVAVGVKVLEIKAHFDKLGKAMKKAIPETVVGKFKASMKLMSRAAKVATNSIARSFKSMARSVSRSLNRMDNTVRLVIMAIAFAAQPLAALSSALSAVGIALLAASAAAVAALAPLIGILAPLVLGIAAAAAGFKDLKKFAPESAAALEGLKKQFKDVAVPSLMKEWGGSLKGFFDSLKGFLSADIFSSIGKAFAKITTSITNVLSGDVGKKFQEALAGPLSDALGTLGSALGPLLSTFLQFLTAAAPFAQILADMFLAWATNLEKAFSGAVADGSFQTFMEKAMTALTAILDLFGAIGDVITTVFSAALEPGIQLLELLGGLVEQFATWLQSAEGQTALTGFFDGIMTIVPPLLELVGALGTALADLVTPEIMTQTANLLTALADVIPVISDLLNIIAEAGVLDILTAALGALGEIIKPLIKPLSDFLSQFSDTLIGVLEDLSPSFGLFGEILGKIFEALTPILPVLGDLIVNFAENLLPAILDLTDAFLPLIDTLLPLLVPLFDTLGPVLGTVAQAIADIMEAIAPFIGILLQALLPLLPPITELIGVLAEIIGDVLVDVIKLLLPFLEPMLEMMGLLVPVLELLSPILELVGTLIGVILDVVLQILQPLLDFMSNTTMVTDAVEKFSGWIQVAIDWLNKIIKVIKNWIDNLDLKKWANDAWTAIKNAFQSMLDWFAALPDKIGKFFDDIASGIKNAFKTAFNYVADVWNNTIGKLSWTVPDWIPVIGGNTIKVPQMKKFAAGAIVDTPTMGVFGDAGAEALVPLSRPLNQVDPSVRGLSAIAQGLTLPGATGPTIAEGAIVINTKATNGRVVAESVLDRIVAYSR